MLKRRVWTICKLRDGEPAPTISTTTENHKASPPTKDKFRELGGNPRGENTEAERGIHSGIRCAKVEMRVILSLGNVDDWISLMIHSDSMTERKNLVDAELPSCLKSSGSLQKIKSADRVKYKERPSTQTFLIRTNIFRGPLSSVNG